MTSAPPGPDTDGSAPGPRPGSARSLLGGVSRRVRTLIVAGGLFLVLLVLAMTLPVPYVVLTPGPTYNTLGTYAVDGKNQDIIGVIGRAANKTRGNLNLTTVSYTTNKLTVFNALSAWLQSNEVVVPRSSLFPPGESTTDVNKQNTEQFSSSQDNAKSAAFCELGYPKAFGVLSVTATGAARGKLRPGDVLVSVDGQAADTYPKLRAVMQHETVGKDVVVVVKRNGVVTPVRITLGKPPAGSTGASLGITVPPTPVCLAPFGIDLGLGNEIGGPSAGMMFALGIIDKVGKIDLTKGRFIAGTGTITPTGVVGPIGGIQLKMIAARSAGATIFLAPAGNCSDVRGATPAGLQVVKVSTLHQAVQDLLAIGKGRAVPHC